MQLFLQERKFVNIYDKENNLLGCHIVNGDIPDGKNFITDSNNSFQIGTFGLPENSFIENHVHKKYERKINITSEVLFVIKGKIKVNFFDDNFQLVNEVIVNQNETIAMFGGGHGIEVLEETKFIEIKQGPYDDQLDKRYFSVD